MNLIATGNTAEVFDYGDSKVLKLFKISGTDLYAEFFKNPEDAEAGMRMLSDLAGIQKKLSSFETTDGISYKDFLRNFGYPDADKLPDGNAVCRGPKEYDVARTVVLLTENNPNAEVTRDAYLQMIGMTWEQVEPFVTGIKWCRNKEMI